MMTKGLKGLALAALLASGAVAADSGVFVGIEGALIKSKADGVSMFESSGTSQSLGLNVGYRFNPDHRVYVGYHTFLGDLKDDDAKALIAGYSWTPEIAKNFRALVGIHGGMTELGGGRDTTMGARLGGIYELNENNEIQFGVKYDQTKFKVDDSEEVDEGKVVNYSGNLKLKNTALFVGYNYKF